MVTIGIKCVDQVLSFINTPLISTGDRNVDKVKFEFCELWNGFVKLAVFYQDKGTPFYSFIGADGIANVPNEIMKLTGSIYIAVTGVNADDQIRTSNVVRYTIEEGVTESDIADIYSDYLPEEEQEDIYHKILELSINMQTLVEDLVKNFAYVRIKDANEFEYDYDKFKVRIEEILIGLTYTKEEMDQIFKQIKTDLNENITSDMNDLKNETNEKFENFAQTMDSKLDERMDAVMNEINQVKGDLISTVERTKTDLEAQIENTMQVHLSTYHSI